MRHGMPLAVTWLLMGAGILPAQQRSPLEPPETSQAAPSIAQQCALRQQRRAPNELPD